MKKNISSFYILIMLCLLVHTSVLAQADSSDIGCERNMSQAWNYLQGKNMQYNPEKAFALISACANNGVPSAMNALGRMYMEGIGTMADKSLAVEWFYKSAVNNYVNAWCNLGMAYKYAQGVDQDFEKSYECFKKASDLGSKVGVFNQGYMLYKGLGCEQNYEAAYRLFIKGAEAGSAQSMYFLGLCFRNGYGIKTDTAQAKMWLVKSAKAGYKHAEEELTAPSPENQISVSKLKSANTGSNIAPAYKNIKHNIKSSNLDGVYSGYLVRYDYSGQYIIKISPLTLEIQRTKNTFTGRWIETDSLISEIEAYTTDSSFIFTSATMQRTDHYHSGKPVTWNFKKATLQVNKTDSAVNLIGNIQMYTPDYMEPGKPMYINLSRDLYNNNFPIGGLQKNRKKDAALVHDVKIFPNPFNNEFRVIYTLKEESEVNIEMYSMSGKLLYKSNFGTMPAGENTHSVNLNIPAGLYTVKIGNKQNKVTHIIIKQ
jgi:hypothetical protein